jgi:hypothetical protein
LRLSEAYVRLSTFKVKLLDRAYNGTARGAVEVTEGDLVGPATGERLVKRADITT